MTDLFPDIAMGNDRVPPANELKMVPWPFKYNAIRSDTVTQTSKTIVEGGDTLMVHGWSGAHALVYNPRSNDIGWIPRAALEETPKVVGRQEVGDDVFFSCPGIFVLNPEIQHHHPGSNLTCKPHECILVHKFLDHHGKAVGINLETGSFGMFMVDANVFVRVDSWLWRM